MDNMVYTYHGILFSLKKERDSGTGYNMNEPEDITLSEINQQKKDHYCMIPLIGGTRSSQIHRHGKAE